MPDTPETPEAPKVDLQAEKAKEGNWEAVARNLAYKVDEREADNFKLREQKRDLKALIPPDGARILTADEAAAADALTAALTEAGIETPEKLTAHLGTFQTARQTAADIEQAKLFKTVETITGAKALALVDVFRDGELFEIEGEAPKDGEDDTRKVYVRKAADAERVEFLPFVDAEKPALKPALFADATPAAPVSAPFPATRTGGPPRPTAPTKEARIQDKAASGEYATI